MNSLNRFSRESVKEGFKAVKGDALDAFVYNATVLEYLVRQDITFIIFSGHILKHVCVVNKTVQSISLTALMPSFNNSRLNQVESKMVACYSELTLLKGLIAE